MLSLDSRGRRDLTSRKERRKTERAQKRAHSTGPPAKKRPKLQHTESIGPDHDALDAEGRTQHTEPPITLAQDQRPVLKSILKTTEGLHKSPEVDKTLAPRRSLTKGLKGIAAKLEEDDKEIAALEKKLGLKGKKGLPQAFKDDGLDELLEGLDEGSYDDIQADSKTEDVGREWLAEKRGKAKAFRGENGDKGDFGDAYDSAESTSLQDEQGPSESESSDIDAASELDSSLDVEDDFDGFESDSITPSLSTPQKRVRENPYVAPIGQNAPAPGKYIPPSLRKPLMNETEDLVQLRRQAQGLVNRLTEANLPSILGSVEELYRRNARQPVTSTLVNVLLTSVCEPTSLPDTLIILPAGFIAAIYKVIGTDFGAHVIQRIVELFDEHYIQTTKLPDRGSAAAESDSSKETSNLVTLLAELYNFQVIGSNLIFDYIRLFLGAFSELNTELLLRIIRISGPQLRQDEPSSLKDIVNMLRPAVASVGQDHISVRTKFMIETINDLKNNRMKTGVAGSTITSEHTVRMKKVLGALNARSIKASEPMRIGLRDIQESDKRGKWWLVGASWAGNEVASNEIPNSGTATAQATTDRGRQGNDSGSSDLIQLAREQRMNTDVRRAIFITIMSSSDYQDAYLRLMKLKLKKVQELEIPKVLIHCSSAEQSYNPYFTLIAKKLCGDRKLKMAFQFRLWDIFRRLGEDVVDENTTDEEEDEDVLGTRQLVNLAKMFGTLIVEGSIGLGVLKNLNLSYLQPRTQMFVEVLLITTILQTQRQSPDRKDEEAVVKVFSKVKDTPQMIRGLQYFLKKVVSKTDIAGGTKETSAVKWACKIATSVLDSLLAALSDRA